MPYLKGNFSLKHKAFIFIYVCVLFVFTLEKWRITLENKIANENKLFVDKLKIALGDDDANVDADDNIFVMKVWVMVVKCK